MKSYLTSFILAIACMLIGACATISHKGENPLSPKELWGMTPLINNTETPYASERATAIAVSILRTRGISPMEVRPAEHRADEGIRAERPVSMQETLERAREQNIRYLFTGTVTEWRYKVGLDGEPVAGVTMQIVDVLSEKVVWSAASGKSGWSREALSAVGQQVIAKMLATLPLAP